MDGIDSAEYMADSATNPELGHVEVNDIIEYRYFIGVAPVPFAMIRETFL